MQLRKMTLMFAALSAASLMMACDGGRTSLACSSDGDCIEGEICHPQAQVCVQTCTTNLDCPTAAKRCEALSGTGTPLICKCDTTPLCQGDTRVSDASTLSCSTTYSVCTDGTTPAPSGCTSDAQCAANQTCNTATKTCENRPAETTCSGTGQTTCSYGQYCSSSKCAPAPVAEASCENFSTGRPAWSSASSSGPVIYSVESTGYEANSNKCGSATAPDAFLVRVRAYRTDAEWPSTRAGLAQFFYVNTAARQFDILNEGLLLNYTRTSGNLKDAYFDTYLCRPSGSTTIQAGYFFTGGNPVCQQLRR